MLRAGKEGNDPGHGELLFLALQMNCACVGSGPDDLAHTKRGYSCPEAPRSPPRFVNLHTKVQLSHTWKLFSLCILTLGSNYKSKVQNQTI